MSASFSPSRTTRSACRILAASLVAALLMGMLLYKAEIRLVCETAVGIPKGAVITMVLLIYLSVPIRALQWRLLLPWRKKSRLRHLVQTQCFGYLGNSLLPFGGGEILKACLLAETISLRVEAVLASMLVMRLQDVLPVLLLTATGTALAANAIGSAYGDVVRIAVPVALAGAVGGGVCLALIHIRGECLANALDQALDRVFPRQSERCSMALRRFSRGLEGVGSIWRLAGSQLCSLACWLLFAAAPVPMLVGFGLDGRDAIRCAIALTGLANLAQLVPITPAGLGTYHAVCALVLSALAPSISYDKAVAFAIVTHAIGAIAPSILGVVVLPGIWTRLGEMTPKRGLTIRIPDASDDASPSDRGTARRNRGSGPEGLLR